MADLVDRIAAEIDTRRRELAPLVDEERRLRDALGALEGMERASRAPAPSSRAATTPATGPRGRRRRLPTAEREEQIVRIVGERPMISSADLASAVGLTRNRLYQLTTALVAQGRIERADGAFIVAAQSAQTAQGAPDVQDAPAQPGEAPAERRATDGPAPAPEDS